LIAESVVLSHWYAIADFFQRVDAFSRGMACKQLRSIDGQMIISRIKTRIKIIQKVIRVFQYPHCVEATT
jgi:hypothetical protein